MLGEIVCGVLCQFLSGSTVNPVSKVSHIHPLPTMGGAGGEQERTQPSRAEVYQEFADILYTLCVRQILILISLVWVLRHYSLVRMCFLVFLGLIRTLFVFIELTLWASALELCLQVVLFSWIYQRIQLSHRCRIQCYDMDFGSRFGCSLCRISGLVKVKHFDLMLWSWTPSDNSTPSYLILRI